MIAIIDYGMGNLRSVEKALSKMGFPAETTSNPEQVLDARGVVLPGVGAFADAMKNLAQLGMVATIKEVISRNKPFLGICLGLQLLFNESEENGNHDGLGIFAGTVKRIPAGVKVPHMGWNQLNIKRNSPVLEGIPDGSNFYFVHSYYVKPDEEDIVVASTEYNLEFVSVVSRGNIFGIQFHPEKSSKLGLAILKNFGMIVTGDENK